MNQEQEKLLLVYWNIRGLAERCRLLLQYLGLPYTQEYYTPETRPKWFEEKKLELQKINPAITLPYLKDGNQYISESDGVLIYLCHKANRVDLLGRNATEQVRVATAQGVFKDLYSRYIQFIYAKQEGKQFEQVKPKLLEIAKPSLNKLDLLLKDKEYFAGEITFIDFVIAEFVQHFHLLDSSIIEEHQNLFAHQKRIFGLPSIKAYIESGRFEERPVNYTPYAYWY